MPNHLAGETSPYLLQHKDNPVDWFPWGPPALALARDTNRPILLSVGYAACHWCHVMAHESFENEAIAALMNDAFVNIKIDREERPDLDAIYQGALALMGQQGGWPLTMFCTPDGKPFAGGTYFPPESRYGRPGFPDVLRQVSRIWQTEPARVTESRDQIMAHLGTILNPAEGGALSMAMLDQAADRIADMVDMEHGGIGDAPKFPHTPALEFLWRAWLRTGKPHLREAVEVSLTAMCQGGIYDHLGGGFARYSVDTHWLVPHFEKMLYDNAQLVDLLTLVWQTTKNPLYAARVEETIGWALREMKGEHTAFYSSLDADSEGEEGKFYVWKKSEIISVLGPGDADFFGKIYDVTEGGNFEGHTILNRLKAPDLLPAADEARLKTMRDKLFAARAARVRPGLDDKMLADWNGLMIAAMARAGAVFGRQDWIDQAYELFGFGIGIVLGWGKASDPDAALHHSARGGQRGPLAMADDYANVIAAAIALESVSAKSIAMSKPFWSQIERLEAHFSAPWGGFYQTSDDADDIIVRSRTIYDNPTPAANAVMLANYARLFALTGEQKYADRAEAIIGLFSGIALKAPVGTATFLNAFELFVEPQTVVIICPAAHHTSHIPETAPEIVRAVQRHAGPNAVVDWRPRDHGLQPNHPAHGKSAVDGKTTVYICRGRTCSLPLTDPAEIAAALMQRSG